jgi:hypothetical protein
MFDLDLFSSIRLLADSLDIVSSTINYLTNVLHFRSLHLRRVPHVLIDELRAKRVAKAIEFFDLLDIQRQIGYRNILTRDES